MGESEGAGSTEDDDTGRPEQDGQSNTSRHEVLRNCLSWMGAALLALAPLHRSSPRERLTDMSPHTHLGLSKPTRSLPVLAFTTFQAPAIHL
ncbi:hypothetical protein SALBM311S_11381 [Streptomyces alboniger]